MIDETVANNILKAGRSLITNLNYERSLKLDALRKERDRVNRAQKTVDLNGGYSIISAEKIAVFQAEVNLYNHVISMFESALSDPTD